MLCKGIETNHNINFSITGFYTPRNVDLVYIGLLLWLAVAPVPMDPEASQKLLDVVDEPGPSLEDELGPAL